MQHLYCHVSILWIWSPWTATLLTTPTQCLQQSGACHVRALCPRLSFIKFCIKFCTLSAVTSKAYHLLSTIEMQGGLTRTLLYISPATAIAHFCMLMNYCTIYTIYKIITYAVHMILFRYYPINQFTFLIRH